MRRISLAAILSILFLVTGISHAQITSGDLVGTVKDATGAVVPNASAIAVNEDTKVTYKTTANSAGEIHIGNLPSGNYDLTVTATGFSTYSLKGITIDINKTSTVPLTLSVSTTQSVEVSAEAGVALDTTTTNLTTTFSTEELASLPTAAVGLGVLNTSLLSPGVASTGGIGIGVGPSVGGQRPRNNNFTIEGIDNNNKAVTGPLVYVPNDSVGNFTLITNQFAPEFGHSSGGQFNTTVISGSNHFHGAVYEYFQNRNLNAASGIAGGKVPNPRYDNNRYGGQVGGPILKDKLFFFVNYERNTIGQSASYYLCTPTSAGLSQLNSLAGTYGFNATNLQQYAKYMPAANAFGGAQVTDVNDNACGNQASGPQYLTVTNGAALSTNIPLGNYLVAAPNFTNFDALTTSVDYTLGPKDSIRGRYIYNTQGSEDTAASLPVFFTTQPFKFHLVALSEYHTFTPNVTNEFRLGFNRYSNTLGSGNFSYPGLDSFPNLTFYDQGGINVGPDGNAPQFTIQNLYQVTDNIGWVKGKHSLKFGFDGRKYISPQGFTQRARGDYQWNTLDPFLHDLAPDSFGQRSTGNHTYYGDQTALYGYANDTWRLTPTVTINAGLRYEFTSVPVGERAQQLNSAASVPGLVSFHAPQPTYTSFAPRFGVNWAPDSKTSVRAGFGTAYDVLFDNLGTLSFPPQYSTTLNVGDPGAPAVLSPNFLKNGGLPAGTGSGTVTYPTTPAGLAAQRAATSALLPDQVLPYAETYTLTVQRTIGSAYTAEIGYVGTRGIHLATQDQINVQPRVNTSNQLGTSVGSTTLIPAASSTTNLAAIKALSNIVPTWLAAGFTTKITSYQPYSQSNYNGLVANLTRRFQAGLQMNLSYTWSKTMDDATAEVFATVLTPRRQQNSQCISCDYSRSALDRTHRISLEALWDLPYYKHSNSFLLRNVVGNWKIAPIYTYESPEYATVLSGLNSNLNGDSATAIGRSIINPNGVKGTGSNVTPVYSAALAANCGAGSPSTAKCNGNLVGYTAINPNAYYIQAGNGTLPNGARNSLPIRPINNIDLSAFKRVTIFEHYSFEFGAQAYNVLNHAQYIPGTLDNVNATSFTSSYNYQTVGNAFFNRPEKQFLNNARTMQLSGKITF
ncbi:MAG TPA: carboxypeptidase regulatory-like domain-containing protein [Edaphobacter sp.]|jgi:hypothetical protein|nr:carboxypeptidase regulatory-like domain-containing protein [Edaphobacter sp.]